MPVVKLKDGTYARVEGTLSPADMKRLGATPVYVPSSRTSAPADAREQDINSRVETRRKYAGGAFNAATQASQHSYTFGFDDNLASGIQALGAGAKHLVTNGFKGTLDAAGEEYNRSQEADRRFREAQEADSPNASTAGAIAGGMANPIGAETGVGRLATKLAPSFMSKVAKATPGIVSRAANSGIGLGVRAGAIQGGLQAVGDTNDGEYLGNAIEGAGQGAMIGGLTGGLISGAGKVASIVKDRAPESTKRVAYERIAAMLNRGRDDTGNVLTPQSATSGIRAADRAGNDMVVADLTPESRSANAYLARRPQSEAANEAALRAENREGQAGDRFASQIDTLMTKGKPADAFSARNNVNTARKAQGKIDYAAGGSMDTPLKVTVNVDKLFRETPPELDVALKSAYRQMLNRGELPTEVATTGSFTDVPNLRTLDYVKRHYDGLIGEAMTAGNRTKAQEMSWQLGQVKKAISDSNPEYADILATQRDAFQRITALEAGDTFIKDMSKPQALMEKIKGTAPEHLDELKYGIADALANMRDKGKTNPVALLRKFMKSPRQRAVLLEVFGDNKTLNKFDGFLRNELKSGETDRMAQAGKNSITGVLKAQGDQMDENALVDIGTKTGTGAAFGGVLGAVTGAYRGYKAVKGLLSQGAQDELTRILGGKGVGLAEGVESANKYRVAREVAARRRAIKGTKGTVAAVGQYSDYSGE